MAADEHTLDYKIVAFSDPATCMNGVYLNFNIPTFESQTFTAEAKYVEIHADSSYTWAGQVQTSGKGDIMLTIKSGAAPSGFIRFTDRYYSIYGLSEYYAILVKHDLSAYDEDNDDTVGEAPSPPSGDCNDTAFVDILILETPAARASLNLLPASYLTTAFAAINFALFQSDVPLRYVRFQRHYNTFTPVGGCSGQDILINSFANNDPFLIGLRNTYKVDGIILLTTCLDQAGWSVPGLNIQRPYAVVDLQHVMGPRFTLAHEFGHLFSAKHNRISNGGDVDDNDPTIKHGWRFFDDDDNEQWTIMAAFPNNARILHYSNPVVNYNGVSTGTSIDNNAFSATVGMCFMAQNEPTMPSLLTVVIEGKKTLCDVQPAFPQVYSAFVTGPSPGIGMGPFNYEWRWSKNMFSPTNPGTVVGGNSPTLTTTGPFTCDGKYYLKLTVTNTIWNIVRQNIKIIDPGLCTNCPDFVSTNIGEPNAPEISLSIAPNPATVSIRLKYKVQPSDPVCLEVLRADGQLLKTATWIASNDGFGEQWIDLSDFDSGLYAVRVVQASCTATRIFSIIK